MTGRLHQLAAAEANRQAIALVGCSDGGPRLRIDRRGIVHIIKGDVTRYEPR